MCGIGFTLQRSWLLLGRAIPDSRPTNGRLSNELRPRGEASAMEEFLESIDRPGKPLAGAKILSYFFCSRCSLVSRRLCGDRLNGVNGKS